MPRVTEEKLAAAGRRAKRLEHESGGGRTWGPLIAIIVNNGTEGGREQWEELQQLLGVNQRGVLGEIPEDCMPEGDSIAAADLIERLKNRPDKPVTATRSLKRKAKK